MVYMFLIHPVYYIEKLRNEISHQLKPVRLGQNNFQFGHIKYWQMGGHPLISIYFLNNVEIFAGIIIHGFQLFSRKYYTVIRRFLRAI